MILLTIVSWMFTALLFGAAAYNEKPISSSYTHVYRNGKEVEVARWVTETERRNHRSYERTMIVSAVLMLIFSIGCTIKACL